MDDEKDAIYAFPDKNTALLVSEIIETNSLSLSKAEELLSNVEPGDMLSPNNIASSSGAEELNCFEDFAQGYDRRKDFLPMHLRASQNKRNQAVDSSTETDYNKVPLKYLNKKISHRMIL